MYDKDFEEIALFHQQEYDLAIGGLGLCIHISGMSIYLNITNWNIILKLFYTKSWFTVTALNLYLYTFKFNMHL